MVKIIEPSFAILTDLEALRPLKMIEIAARTCYQSWNYMDVNSAPKLVKHLVERKHWAMIEHGGVVTVRFIANRGFSHELVRHRIASFGQESTRYVDYAKGLERSELEEFGLNKRYLTIIKPIECPMSVDDLNSLLKVYKNRTDGTELEELVYIREFMDKYGEDVAKDWAIWLTAMIEAENAYFELRDADFPPQLARSVLPIGIKSEIVITANLREWYHIFKLRTSEYAHPLIRTLMRGVLKEFKKHIPIIFDKLPDYED